MENACFLWARKSFVFGSPWLIDNDLPSSTAFYYYYYYYYYNYILLFYSTILLVSSYARR